MAQDLAILLRDIRRAETPTLEQPTLTYAAQRFGVDETHLRAWVDITNLHHGCRITGGLARAVLRDGKMGGAQQFMARTWQTARQSYGCAELADVQAFVAPLEAPGLAALEKKTAA